MFSYLQKAKPNQWYHKELDKLRIICTNFQDNLGRGYICLFMKPPPQCELIGINLHVGKKWYKFWLRNHPSPYAGQVSSYNKSIQEKDFPIAQP